MARYFSVHPVDPQRRTIGQVVDLIRDGGLISYPTDSCFALGCRLGNSVGLHRIREIRHSITNIISPWCAGTSPSSAGSSTSATRRSG